MKTSIASLVAFAIASSAFAQDALVAEQERVEDLRKLHRAAIAVIQDNRTLARYLAKWGGPDRDPEVDTMMVEAEGLYGVVRASDHGGQSLQVARDLELNQLRKTKRDAEGKDADVSSIPLPEPDEAQLALLASARRFAAADVIDLFDRATAMKAELVSQIRAKASEARPFEIVYEPMPWTDDPVREASRADGLQYGWSLNDEFFGQSDEDQAYMVGKAAAMGVRFANIDWAPASDWALMEPNRGEYDFAALDHALALLRTRGIHAVPRLRTMTGTPPAWLAEAAGDTCRMSVAKRDNKGVVSTNAVGINLSDEATRAAYSSFLTAYAAHLRDTAADMVDAISGDTRIELEAPADLSAAIDREWRAAGNDSPWIPPESPEAGDKLDTAARLRAESFRERWMVRYYETIRDALKAGWPEAAVQLPVSSDDFHRMIDAITGASRDFAALATVADIDSTATDSPAGFNLLRSLAGGRQIWNHMIHSGCGMCGSTAASHVPFYDSVHIIHGDQGRSMRQNFPGSWFRYADRQISDNGIGNHWIAPLRMQEIAPTLLGTRPVDAEVAVLWSQCSLRLAKKNFYKSAMAWGHLLQRIQMPYDYIAEDALADALPRYRVLILPNCQSMRSSDAATIREWVRDGGILLGFGAPGLYDETGAIAADAEGNAALPLSDVFGAGVAAMRQPGPVQPDKLQTTHPEGCFQFGNLPPRDYKFRTDLAATLSAGEGTPRAWYDGAGTEVAIVEHRFGEGEALLCGFPLGFEYWESAPYELALGMTHHRNPNHNAEQKRYEAWTLSELSRRGISRPVVLPHARYLRSQRGDDPDWYHVYRNGPNYQEYMFEEERPVRASYAFARRREGVDATYVGIANTEINYMWERGYFCSTLAGAFVTAEVAVPEAPAEGAGLVVDARLGVPVPFGVTPAKDATESAPASPARLSFTAWIPAAQSAMFAVTSGSSVRLFGEGMNTGDDFAAVRARVEAAAAGERLAEGVTLFHPDLYFGFFESLLEKGEAVIGCGDRRFLSAANSLAKDLNDRFGIAAKVTMAGARIENCRDDYMDGYGWASCGKVPLHADILVGNCQDNGLMYDFISLQGACRWLPLEVNQDFPGVGRSIVMLSSPYSSRADGRHSAQADATPRQLVIGASQPADAEAAAAKMHNWMFGKR